MLVDALGFEQTLILLKSGAIRVRCYMQAIAQTGQTDVRGIRDKPLLPFSSYCVATVHTSDQETFLSRCFQEIQTEHPLPTKQAIRLKQAILNQLEQNPTSISPDTLSQFHYDIINKTNAFSKALERILREELGVTTLPNHLSLAIHPLDTEDFHVETNLETSWGLDRLRAHKIVERAVLSVGALNFRIAQMKGFHALSGFQTNDLPLFEDKMLFLTNTLDPGQQEQRFGRIVTVLGLPDLSNVGKGASIDIETFLKVRDSAECQAFRTWLSTINTATDDEIRQHVQSLQARIATALNQPLVKGVRFLATTFVGALPVGGAILGIGAGVIDSFVINKLLPESPIVTFLGAKYPALFQA